MRTIDRMRTLSFEAGRRKGFEEALEMFQRSLSSVRFVERFSWLVESPDMPLDSTVEVLDLGVRSYNCVKRAGINFVRDLVDKTEAELRAIPNMGTRNVDEIKENLARFGYSLKPE
ncbi:MAG TPA: DNA-directed RNA polymerase subunit alpha C-terminal domain-containing protein [Candidatus Saccharimonadales bacterium]